jgi:DNA-binding transcriptional LysR family regulator
MELRHLRYFVAVAEELNFTRAAKRLGINQPGLSFQIRQLEKEMGTALFYRRTRGVELTTAGKLLLEEAYVILKQVEAAKISVGRRARAEIGQINIGSSAGTYFHPLIPAIIREYGMHFPDVILHPQAHSTSLMVARLRAGLIDIAFIRLPINDSEGLAVELLVDEPTVMVLPTGHKLSGSASVPLAAFAEETFVLFPRELNPANYDVIISAFKRAGFSPKLGQQAPLAAEAIPLVAAGLGVSIVPRWTAEVFTQAVEYRPIDNDPPRALIGSAHRRDDRSPAVRNFIATARAMRRAQDTGNGIAKVTKKDNVQRH